MPFFAKESLETLKQRIDLVEVVSSYVELRRAGASYKGLCPFHDEKTPSFVIQKGQRHYHCFGCGVHGDAISFLMQYSKLSFFDAVESLAQRYHVIMERVEGHDDGKVDRRALKNTLEQVCSLYQTLLLHTEAGHIACRYLAARGIDLDFIRRFRLGYAIPDSSVLYKVMAKKGISRDLLVDAGIIVARAQGGHRELFSDRITFPICDSSGAVVGFSARKFKEETFGGKYVNTPETPLFKKSRLLYGLHLSRRRIAKERRALLVEGQVDALRLLEQGIDWVVAAQGTAFGEGHLKELMALGLSELFLALDADQAGSDAAVKIGTLCQKHSVGVKVVRLADGMDPDSIVRQQGLRPFLHALDASEDFLTFLVDYYSSRQDVDTPAGKNSLVNMLTTEIRQWSDPIMVHESLRHLARLLKLPEEMVIGNSSLLPTPLLVKQSGYAGILEIDPDRVLESEFLRWLVVAGEHQLLFMTLAIKNLQPDELSIPICRRVYEACLPLHQSGEPFDLLTLAIALEDGEGQEFLAELMVRRVDLDRAEELFVTTLQKILDRNWMRQREALRLQIQSGNCSDDEVQKLLLQFDHLRRHPPQIVREG